jgi:dolichyl-phosphate-mannose--protein O-mannosyl transferase
MQRTISRPLHLKSVFFLVTELHTWQLICWATVLRTSLLGPSLSLSLSLSVRWWDIYIDSSLYLLGVKTNYQLVSLSVRPWKPPMNLSLSVRRCELLYHIVSASVRRWEIIIQLLLSLTGREKSPLTCLCLWSVKNFLLTSHYLWGDENFQTTLSVCLWAGNSL